MNEKTKNKLLKFRCQLDECKGMSASFVMFTHSHFNMFVVELFDLTSQKKIGLGFSKCSYISGMMGWNSANLSAYFDNDNSLYVISDEGAGFLVKCVDVVFINDMDDEYELDIRFKIKN